MTSSGSVVNRTDRLYALVDELRRAAPRGRSARWLAERFEVSSRTIERDLLSLQQAGVPIWATPGPGGGYSLDPAMTLPPLNLTPAEATAIAVALAGGRLVPFGEAGRSALRKIVAAMTTGGRRGAEDLASRIHLVDLPGDEPAVAPDVLRAVERALAERRVLRIDYVDREGVRTEGRPVEPAALLGGRRGWYLMGWCRLRGGGRAFRLDRVQAAQLTDQAAPPRHLHEVAEDAERWVRALTLDG